MRKLVHIFFVHRLVKFILEDIFGRSTVGTVNPDFRHRLPVLHGNFVHPEGIQAIDIFGLFWATSEAVSEVAGEVADLADMDTDVRIKGA